MKNKKLTYGEKIIITAILVILFLFGLILSIVFGVIVGLMLCELLKSNLIIGSISYVLVFTFLSWGYIKLLNML